jgi:hypothetical protein
VRQNHALDFYPRVVDPEQPLQLLVECRRDQNRRLVNPHHRLGLAAARLVNLRTHHVAPPRLAVPIDDNDVAWEIAEALEGARGDGARMCIRAAADQSSDRGGNGRIGALGVERHRVFGEAAWD